MKNIITILVFAFICLGCSDERDINISDDTIKSGENLTRKGEIPKEMSIHKELSIVTNHSLLQLMELYKEDSNLAAGREYAANLKNMWLIVIAPKLLSEGNDEQKLFFINEQLDSENNLPHLGSFYQLLASAKSIPADQRLEFASEFFDKNFEVIQKVKWHTAAEKKDKEEELLMAKRSFAILSGF